MKLYLNDQTKNFPKLLEHFKKMPIIKYDSENIKETETSVSLHFASHFNSLKELSLVFFEEYQIFPSEILKAYPQWTDEKRKIAVGDTILLQINVPPNSLLSEKFITAVRIKDIVNQDDRLAYTYEALEGHIEKGWTEISIERQGELLIFKIKTALRPAHVLTNVFAPIYTMHYQTYCINRALQNMRLEFMREIRSASPKKWKSRDITIS